MRRVIARGQLRTQVDAVHDDSCGTSRGAMNLYHRGDFGERSSVRNTKQRQGVEEMYPIGSKPITQGRGSSTTRWLASRTPSLIAAVTTPRAELRRRATTRKSLRFLVEADMEPSGAAGWCRARSRLWPRQRVRRLGAARSPQRPDRLRVGAGRLGAGRQRPWRGRAEPRDTDDLRGQRLQHERPRRRRGHGFGDRRAPLQRGGRFSLQGAVADDQGREPAERDRDRRAHRHRVREQWRDEGPGLVSVFNGATCNATNTAGCDQTGRRSPSG